MSSVGIDIHRVSRVSVLTVKRAAHDSIKDDYVVHHVVIHYTDRLGQITTLDLDLFGEHGLAEVPFMFGAVVDETAKVESRETPADEPSPALKLEIQRDLDGALRHGKVFGEFLNSMLSPKK